MPGDQQSVRVRMHDPELIPRLHWYLRWLVWKGWGGRLDFTSDVLWFTPDLPWLVRAGRRRVVAWDDVLAVDFRPGTALTPMGLYLRDRSFRFIGMVHTGAAERLGTVGFEVHSKPSWPDRRLWTRPGDRPDWDLLHSSM